MKTTPKSPPQSNAKYIPLFDSKLRVRKYQFQQIYILPSNIRNRARTTVSQQLVKHFAGFESLLMK